MTVFMGLIGLVGLACTFWQEWENRELRREIDDLQLTNKALRDGVVYWQRKASPSCDLWHPLHHPTRWSTLEELIGQTTEEGEA